VYPHPEFRPGLSGFIGRAKEPGYPFGRTPGVVFDRIFQFKEPLFFGSFIYRQNFVYPGNKVQGKPLGFVLIRRIPPETFGFLPVRLLHVVAEEETRNYRQLERVLEPGFLAGIFNLDTVMV
jgi:hypothetical protein